MSRGLGDVYKRQAWEESDKGHRELLLNPKVKKMGCGYSYSGTIGYPVWALEMTD